MKKTRSILVTLVALWLVSPPSRAALPTVDPPEVSVAHSLDAFRQAVRSGGPGKDGIPSIDRPHFQSANAADAMLEDRDKVVGLYLDGQARAYPQRILVWHEIVNDELRGKPLSITYCPLTGSALAFHRGDTELGVSGRLVNSNLVMYDRATDSQWPQMLGVAIDGPLTGQGLEEVRVIWTTWGAWKARHPQTQVLTQQTGYVRNYRRDPYGSYNPTSGYYLPESDRLFPVMAESQRLLPKATVLGFRTETDAAAVPTEVLRREGVINLLVGESHYSIVHDSGLDTGWVLHNPRRTEIRVDDLHFGPGGVSGGGTQGLTSINAYEAMWFAWEAFYPDTLLYRGEGRGRP